ncbi:hypothetical protein [Paracoccus everestensis]|uniref:hypothetical protein n=1 Tax=Paracoccus everestensis TaxID=2903900 RepID=UPI001F31A1EE|nr:hypothetical protein [Paracoccus everestensis]
MKKHEGHTWWDREFMQQLAKDFEPQFCVGFMVLASYVDDRGELGYQNAVDALVAADRDLDEPKAREMITQFTAKGMVTEQGQSLVFPGFGTDFIPNQKTRAED